MITLEEIEKEYETFDIKTKEVQSMDYFIGYHEVGQEDAEELIKVYNDEIKGEKAARVIDRVNCFINFISLEDEIDYIGEDINIIKDMISHTEEYQDYYRTMERIATRFNFLELTRLIDFSTEYYNKQAKFYDYKRQQLEMHASHIQVYNPNVYDTREVFKEFMNKKLKEIEEYSIEEIESDKKHYNVEDDYETYIVRPEVKLGIQDSTTLYLNIEAVLAELELSEKEIVKERRKTIYKTNLRDLKNTRSYYKKILEIIDKNIGALVFMEDVIAENNFRELVKLLDFMITGYADNVKHYQNKIETISYHPEGYDFVNERYKYNHEELMQFVKNKLKGLNSEKELEKK